MFRQHLKACSQGYEGGGELEYLSSYRESCGGADVSEIAW